MIIRYKDGGFEYACLWDDSMREMLLIYGRSLDAVSWKDWGEFFDVARRVDDRDACSIAKKLLDWGVIEDSDYYALTRGRET